MLTFEKNNILNNYHQLGDDMEYCITNKFTDILLRLYSYNFTDIINCAIETNEDLLYQMSYSKRCNMSII